MNYLRQRRGLAAARFLRCGRDKPVTHIPSRAHQTCFFCQNQITSLTHHRCVYNADVIEMRAGLSLYLYRLSVSDTFVTVC